MSYSSQGVRTAALKHNWHQKLLFTKTGGVGDGRSTPGQSEINSLLRIPWGPLGVVCTNKILYEQPPLYPPWDWGRYHLN